eukprot:COSAG01_NODE_1191_length_11314_cov_59.567722_6_plen_79_part_00
MHAGRRGRELLQMSASVHDWVSVLHRWLAQLPSPLVPWHDGGGGGGGEGEGPQGPGTLGRKLDQLAHWGGPWCVLGHR